MRKVSATEAAINNMHTPFSGLESMYVQCIYYWYIYHLDAHWWLLALEYSFWTQIIFNWSNKWLPGHIWIWALGKFCPTTNNSKDIMCDVLEYWFMFNIHALQYVLCMYDLHPIYGSPGRGYIQYSTSTLWLEYVRAYTNIYRRMVVVVEANFSLDVGTAAAPRVVAPYWHQITHPRHTYVCTPLV